MKRQVFISTDPNPLALFPDQKFRKKREIYHNANTIIITEFIFFSLMTILELEEEANEKISRRMQKFFYILSMNERSVETLLSKPMHIDVGKPEKPLKTLRFNNRKRMVLSISLVNRIVNSKKFENGEEITSEVHRCVQQTKHYIETSDKDVENLHLKYVSPYIVARGHATKKIWKDSSRMTKTQKNNYRIGVLKTEAKNFKILEKAFVDYGERKIVNLDIIIIYLTDDKSIYLSIKPNIKLSAFEILVKRYGKLVRGDALLAQTTSYETSLEESKELMHFIASNY